MGWFSGFARSVPGRVATAGLTAVGQEAQRLRLEEEEAIKKQRQEDSQLQRQLFIMNEQQKLEVEDRDRREKEANVTRIRSQMREALAKNDYIAAQATVPEMKVLVDAGVIQPNEYEAAVKRVSVIGQQQAQTTVRQEIAIKKMADGNWKEALDAASGIPDNDVRIKIVEQIAKSKLDIERAHKTPQENAGIKELLQEAEDRELDSRYMQHVGMLPWDDLTEVGRKLKDVPPELKRSKQYKDDVDYARDLISGKVKIKRRNTDPPLAEYPDSTGTTPPVEQKSGGFFSSLFSSDEKPAVNANIGAAIKGGMITTPAESAAVQQVKQAPSVVSEIKNTAGLNQEEIAYIQAQADSTGKSFNEARRLLEAKL